MKPSHVAAIRKSRARRARGGSYNRRRTVHATPISSSRFDSSGNRYRSIGRAHTVMDEPAIRTVAMPRDTNPAGDIFGGWLMSQMDLAGGVVAARHAHGRCATVCVEAIEFQRPVHVGDEVSLYASLTAVGRASMRIRVEACRRLRTGEEYEQVTAAVFVFVALDEAGRPRPVPPLASRPRSRGGSGRRAAND